jgi:hypothetical protein
VSPEALVINARSWNGSVEAALRLFQTLAHDQLERVGRASDEFVAAVMGLERRENEVGDVAWVTAARASDADAESKELRTTERLRDRPQSVVAG